MQSLTIKSHKGEAITSVDEWFRLAPPERRDFHWKDSRSGKELAKAWFRGGVARVPDEIPDRIDLLTTAIFNRVMADDDGTIGAIRYQLLHGVGGAVAEACRRGAGVAAFVVHEFHSKGLDNKRLERNAENLTTFVSLLEGRQKVEAVPGHFAGSWQIRYRDNSCTRDVTLLIGKVVSDIGAQVLPSRTALENVP